MLVLNLKANPAATLLNPPAFVYMLTCFLGAPDKNMSLKLFVIAPISCVAVESGNISLPTLSKLVVFDISTILLPLRWYIFLSVMFTATSPSDKLLVVGTAEAVVLLFNLIIDLLV